MRWWLALGLAACRFDPGSSGASVSDAPHSVGDAPAPDAQPVPPDAPAVRCTEQPTGSVMMAGTLGNSSGSGAEPDLTCAAGELPVGFSFDTTPTSPPGWNEPVVSVTHVRCGRIAAPPTGSITTTLAETTASTIGQCAGWPTPTQGTEIDCPSGSVIVGMSGNEAKDGSDHSQFDSVAMLCEQLSPMGMPMGMPTMVAFTDTGAAGDAKQMVMCGGGQALVSVGVHALCGQDALIVQCAQATCQ